MSKFSIHPVTRPTIIVQARMSSARLPGKMLRQVAGKSILAYVTERLQRVDNVAGLIVATSAEAGDDSIAEACSQMGIECFRGDLHDVAGRFLAVIEQARLDAFVRVCGDSPMIDPDVVRRAVTIFGEGGCDVVSNVVERTFPKGQSVEVVRAAPFAAVLSCSRADYDREHVTPALYRQGQGVTVHSFTMSPNLSHVQLSVDTQSDFEVFEKIVAMMDKPHWTYGVAELIEMREQILDKERTA